MAAFFITTVFHKLSSHTKPYWLSQLLSENWSLSLFIGFYVKDSLKLPLNVWLWPFTFLPCLHEVQLQDLGKVSAGTMDQRLWNLHQSLLLLPSLDLLTSLPWTKQENNVKDFIENIKTEVKDYNIQVVRNQERSLTRGNDLYWNKNHS